MAGVSLDMLRSRSSRLDAQAPQFDRQVTAVEANTDGSEDEAVLADAVGSALVAVLERLTPAERLAFVLHDSFAVSFDEIGSILERSPQAAKQLAMRARTKVRGTDNDLIATGRTDRRIVDAFLTASRAGDFTALVALLHPDITLNAGHSAVRMGSPPELIGATAVAGMFSGRALGAEPALINGAPGLVWIVKGAPKVAWELAIVDGAVTQIEMLADADTLASSTITTSS